MIKEGKIGVYGTVCLIVIATSNKIFFIAPGVVARLVGNSGWIMTLISCAGAVIMFSFIYLLLKRFPGMDIVEIFNISMGRFIGYLLNFLFSMFFLASTGVLLREFTDILKIFSFPNTPVGVLNMTGTVFITATVYLGLETISRIASLIGRGVMILYILLLILSIKDFDFYNIFPVFGYGVKENVYYGLQRTSAYAEILILPVIAGALQGAKYIKKAGYISLVLSGLILSLALLCYTFTFKYTANQELVAPFYTMVRLINFGAFVQRLDPLLMFVWIITTLITLSIYFYCSVSVFCKIHRINDTRPVIYPMAILILIAAIIPQNLSDLAEVFISDLREMGNILMLFPIIALIASVIRRKKGGKNNA